MAKGQSKQLSNEQRYLIVNMVLNRGKRICDVARDLMVKYSTVARVIRQFNQEERIERKKRSGRKRSFGTPVKQKIERFYATKPEATLMDCQNHLRSECQGPVPSISTIDRILGQQKVTLKVASLVPPERNAPETIEKRKKYVTKFSRLELHSNFVFIDEFGCSLALRRGRARSKRGTPAIVFGKSRSRNMSVIAAIDKDGPIYHTSKFGSVDQFVFVSFLESLVERLDASKEHILVFDNLKVHTTENVKRFLNEKKVKFMLLPPWSPMLNPIEECFSKVKNLIIKFKSDGEDLFRAVDMAFERVTRDNCATWYNHIKEFFPQCLESRPVHTKPDPNAAWSDDEWISDNEPPACSEDELLNGLD